MTMLKIISGVAMLATMAAGEFKCLDVTMENDAKCHVNIDWAMNSGKFDHPEYYPNGTTSRADYQCAIFLKLGVEGDANDKAMHMTPNHNCTLPPCTPITAGLAASGVAAACIKPVETPVPEDKPDAPSMPWWGWVLIVAGVLLAALATAFAMGVFSKAPKKKRAAKLPPPRSAAPEPLPTTVTPVPTFEVAPPIYTYVAEPVYTATRSIQVTSPSVLVAPAVYVN
eukprot:TRINITY_DN2741_c0_g1_i1.p1 TRINITY_DN2741_c0_g1~~TRINITY_DN2741_c0_g1_i1.p1  ORF type:complete len:226 (+),score=41.35 TRINITY_DN2741_c0_g1_i1:73-750(+)